MFRLLGLQSKISDNIRCIWSMESRTMIESKQFRLIISISGISFRARERKRDKNCSGFKLHPQPQHKCTTIVFGLNTEFRRIAWTKHAKFSCYFDFVNGIAPHVWFWMWKISVVWFHSIKCFGNRNHGYVWSVYFEAPAYCFCFFFFFLFEHLKLNDNQIWMNFICGKRSSGHKKKCIAVWYWNRNWTTSAVQSSKFRNYVSFGRYRNSYMLSQPFHTFPLCMDLVFFSSLH